MEIASAAWAQWAGGRGRCLKEMGNPVRGEVTTTAVPLGCEPSGHGGCQSGLAAWASSSFSLTPCSGSPGPVPFDFPPFPQNLRMAGGRVCGRPGFGVLEAPVVQPNPAGSGTHRRPPPWLAVGSPGRGPNAAPTRWRAAKSLPPPYLQLQTVRTDFDPHVTITFPAEDTRNLAFALRRD